MVRKRKRRENGEGSVFQVRGRWRAQISLPRRDGRAAFHTKSFVTRDEANDWRIAQIHAINRGTSVAPDKMTVAGWMKYWLEEIVIPPNTRLKTHESYRYLSSKHIEPELGNVLLQKLSQPQVQTLLNRKAKTLSPKTTKHVRDTLRAALNVAKEHGIIGSNPAEKARGPKIEEYHARIFSKEEALKFLGAIKGHPLEGAFLIELVFGLRRGEVLGLKPEDLDWEKEIFGIHRQLQWVQPPGSKKGEFFVGPPKSKRSVRMLPLIDPWAAALRERLAWRRRRRAELGDRWVESGFLFTTEVGTRINPRNYQRSFDAILTKAGLPKIRLHSLRNVANTVLALLGVHPRIAMQITGSSDVRVAMETYTAVSPESVREAAQALGAYYRARPRRGKQRKSEAEPATTTDATTDGGPKRRAGETGEKREKGRKH